MKAKSIILLFLLIASYDAFAQSFYARRRDQRFSVGGGLGYSVYLGELTNPGSYFDTKHNIEAYAKYMIHPYVNLRTSVLWFRLSGDDLDLDPELGTHVRNLRFESDNIEWNLMAEITTLPMTFNPANRPIVNPYFTIGVGLMWFNPSAPIPEQIRLDGEVVNTADYLSSYSPGDRVGLRQLNTERRPEGPYDPFAFVIPMGIGVKFKVTNYVDISAEVTGRITFTDYLDDLSRFDYPDQSEFNWENADGSINEMEFIALAMSKPSTSNLSRRGSPDTNDYYMIFSLKADIYLATPAFLSKIFGRQPSFGGYNNKKLMQKKRRNPRK